MKPEDLQKLIESQFPGLPRLRAAARPHEEIRAIAPALTEYVRNLLLQMVAGGDAMNLEAVNALHAAVSAQRATFGDGVRTVLAYHLLTGSTYNPGEVEQCVHVDFPAPDHLLGKGGLVERIIQERRDLFPGFIFDFEHFSTHGNISYTLDGSERA